MGEVSPPSRIVMAQSKRVQTPIVLLHSLLTNALILPSNALNSTSAALGHKIINKESPWYSGCTITFTFRLILFRKMLTSLSSLALG